MGHDAWVANSLLLGPMSVLVLNSAVALLEDLTLTARKPTTVQQSNSHNKFKRKNNQLEVWGWTR